jgi:hypothetical protein
MPATAPVSEVQATYVKDNLYPAVEKAFSNPANVKKLKDYIGRYIDRNNEILFSTNFSVRLILSDLDKAFIFNLLGMKEREINAIITRSPDIGHVNWVSNPFTVCMALCIRYFAIHKMEEEAALCNLFVSCLFYTLMHSRSFPHLPNKEIMDYTLNKNPKVINSFIIKKEGTIFGMIRYTGITSHQFYIGSLVGECTDLELNTYLSAIRTRIGSNMKNLSTYFYEDHKANNYLNKDSDSYDENNFHLSDNTMLGIAKISSKVATSLSSYRFNHTSIERAARSDVSVSVQKLTQILDNVIEMYRRDLDRFVSDIIELYIVEGGNKIDEISGIKFLTHSYSLYKTNSTRPKVIGIKETLDKWIEDGSKKFGNQFVRAATLNAYRKAIFLAFVHEISRAAK